MNIYQIYFKEEQLPLLDYQPYFNSKCTPFFESEVIRSLIEDEKHLEGEYFGVLSYQLREKMGFAQNDWKSIPEISSLSKEKFDPVVFELIVKNRRPDVMSFQNHPPHDPISFADRFHPGFSAMFKHIMEEIGYTWTPTVFKDVFYCQYFVAKAEIYGAFANDMLIPAMEVMKTMPELMMNSGYPKSLPENLRREWGVNWYPYHSFLCERMFSFYAHLHKLSCLHY